MGERTPMFYTRDVSCVPSSLLQRPENSLRIRLRNAVDWLRTCDSGFTRDEMAIGNKLKSLVGRSLRNRTTLTKPLPDALRFAELSFYPTFNSNICPLRAASHCMKCDYRKKKVSSIINDKIPLVGIDLVCMGSEGYSQRDRCGDR